MEEAEVHSGQSKLQGLIDVILAISCVQIAMVSLWLLIVVAVPQTRSNAINGVER